MPRFTFARGNALKIVSGPLYLLGALAAAVVPRRDNLWVFASGSGVGEGALELYRHVASIDPTVRLVWLARTHDEARHARELGLVSAVRSTWRGFRLTLRARVVVVTHGLGDANRFGMNGAFVVQLWHGIPLKRIQLDSPVTFRSRFAPSGMLRALYRRSTGRIGLVSAASEVSAARLRTAFGLPHDRVVVTGDPRDDAVLRDPAHARQLLEAAVGTLGSDRVLLYAPTWRDGDADPGVPTRTEWDAIRRFLERTSSVLLVRPHPLGLGDYADSAPETRRIRMLAAGALPDITPALPGVDLLVTDYSSIAYDFALTGRPIAFLAPDLHEYAASRGLYEPYEQFSGGHHVTDWGTLLARLDDPGALTALAAHSVALAERHHKHRDGRNTQRVHHEILRRLGHGTGAA